jgi:ankyrin repeat protein
LKNFNYNSEIIKVYGPLKTTTMNYSIEDLINETLILCDNKEHAQILLNIGADIHYKSDLSLILACENKSLELVEFLLTNGGNPNAIMELYWEDIGESGEILSVLDYTISILSFHAKEGNLEVVKLLLGFGSNDVDQALIYSCDYGHFEIVKLFLEHNVNIHANDDEVLRWSARNGNLEVVKLLLEHGANVHAQDDNDQNNNALRWSAKHGHTEIVKLLLAYGADIHASEDEAIINSARNGNLEMVKLLLEHGANVHAQDNHALKWSAQNGHTEIVKLLLKYYSPKYILQFNLHKIKGVRKYMIIEYLNERRKIIKIQRLALDKLWRPKGYICDKIWNEIRQLNKNKVSL